MKQNVMESSKFYLFILFLSLTWNIRLIAFKVSSLSQIPITWPLYFSNKDFLTGEWISINNLLSLVTFWRNGNGNGKSEIPHIVQVTTLIFPTSFPGKSPGNEVAIFQICQNNFLIIRLRRSQQKDLIKDECIVQAGVNSIKKYKCTLQVGHLFL